MVASRCPKGPETKGHHAKPNRSKGKPIRLGQVSSLLGQLDRSAPRRFASQRGAGVAEEKDLHLAVVGPELPQQRESHRVKLPRCRRKAGPQSGDPRSLVWYGRLPVQKSTGKWVSPNNSNRLCLGMGAPPPPPASQLKPVRSFPS